MRSTRLYAGLLRLYPAPFRARYRDEMVLLFADQLRDAQIERGLTGLLLTWLRTLPDLAKTAIGEHLRRDRTVAQSLATFEPTRSMRLLGLLAILGGVLLLWAFVSWNPFAEQSVNSIRLGLFWAAGIAVAIAFHARQSAVSPRLAVVATGAVVVAGAWNILWILIAVERNSPFAGAFGFAGFIAGFAGWLIASFYGASMLVIRASWRGMSRWAGVVTRIAALSLLVGGPVATFGMDRLGLTRSEPYGEVFGTLGALGVGAVGLGWLLLGTVLVLGPRRTAATA